MDDARRYEPRNHGESRGFGHRLLRLAMPEAHQGSRGNRDEDDSKKRPRDSTSADGTDGAGPPSSDEEDSSDDGEASAAAPNKVRSSASASNGSNDEGDGRSWRSRSRSKRGADHGAVEKQSRDECHRERREIHDALEHLMVVGNAWRHHDWRLRLWRETARPEEFRDRRLETSRPLVHPRDEREYSVLSVAMEGFVLPAPESESTDHDDRRHRLQDAMDDDWDAACFGDGVRLQELYDRSPDGSRCPIRDLVLRSWERAMSIASNTVAATAATPPVGDGDGDGEDPSEFDESGGSLQHSAKRRHPASSPSGLHRAARLLTRSMGRAQCALLNLELEDPESKVCRTCGVEFDSTHRVLDHYYGDGNDKVRGCCWILIRREQEKLLRQTLQDQVEGQVTSLLRAVAAPPRQDEGSGSWDWQDVVKAAERTSNSENDSGGGRMSPSAVDAATRRLVERYANVPR